MLFRNILPYIEENTLHDLGKGQAMTSAAFRDASIRLHQTPLSGFLCPTRRAPRLFLSRWVNVMEQTWLANIAQTQGVAKSDYAASSGDATWISGDSLYRPASYAAIDDSKWTKTHICRNTGILANDVFVQYCQTGVMFYRSEIKVAKVTDGTSKTYLAGEKWMPLFGYDGTASLTDPGFTYGDNQSIYTGYESDNHRAAWTMTASAASQEDSQPKQDQAGVLQSPAEVRQFGSAHTSAFNMAFCDGSVQSISYDIDPVTHSRLASRLDGESVTIP